MIHEILRTMKRNDGSVTGYARVETFNDYETALNKLGEYALIIPASELVLVEVKPMEFKVQVTKL